MEPPISISYSWSSESFEENRGRPPLPRKDLVQDGEEAGPAPHRQSAARTPPPPGTFFHSCPARHRLCARLSSGAPKPSCEVGKTVIGEGIRAQRG